MATTHRSANRSSSISGSAISLLLVLTFTGISFSAPRQVRQQVQSPEALRCDKEAPECRSVGRELKLVPRFWVWSSQLNGSRE